MCMAAAAAAMGVNREMKFRQLIEFRHANAFPDRAVQVFPQVNATWKRSFAKTNRI